jgi:hypothetical protein
MNKAGGGKLIDKTIRFGTKNSEMCLYINLGSGQT